MLLTFSKKSVVESFAPVNQYRSGSIIAVLHVNLRFSISGPVLHLLLDGVGHPGLVVGLHVVEVHHDQLLDLVLRQDWRNHIRIHVKAAKMHKV